MVDFILEVLVFLCHDLCRSCKCLGHHKGVILKSTNLGTHKVLQVFILSLFVGGILLNVFSDLKQMHDM